MKQSETSNNNGFKLIEPIRKRINKDEILIKPRYISFGQELNEYFKKNGERIEIYINKRDGLIGFKTSKNKIKSFKLRKYQDCRSYCGIFSRDMLPKCCLGIGFAQKVNLAQKVYKQ